MAENQHRITVKFSSPYYGSQGEPSEPEAKVDLFWTQNSYTKKWTGILSIGSTSGGGIVEASAHIGRGPLIDFCEQALRVVRGTEPEEGEIVRIFDPEQATPIVESE
jgi:hypothetical protein